MKTIQPSTRLERFSLLLAATRVMTFVLLTSVGFSRLAIAKDEGYRYNRKLRACVNAGGSVGLNAKHAGECGDLWGWAGENAPLFPSSEGRRVLAGANLNRADLSGQDLSGVDFSGARMLLTNLHGARLEGAIYDERTVLPFSKDEAKERGMIFQHSREADYRSQVERASLVKH